VLGRPEHITGEPVTTLAVQLVSLISSFRPPPSLVVILLLTCLSCGHPRWDKPPNFCFGLLIFFDNVQFSNLKQPNLLQMAEEPWKYSNPLLQGEYLVKNILIFNILNKL
jgi:hypothetical protein